MKLFLFDYLDRNTNKNHKQGLEEHKACPILKGFSVVFFLKISFLKHSIKNKSNKNDWYQNEFFS